MGYDCVYPSGAFYLFVKSPEADAKAFSDKAKKLNLLITGRQLWLPWLCPRIVLRRSGYD